MTRQLVWDGESIKQKIVTDEKKFTPKDILDSLYNVRSQMNQMEQQLKQMEQQQKQVKTNLQSASEFEAQLKEFEAKCKELQEEKLKHLIGVITDECKEKAAKSSAESIGKDPEAYSDNQKKILPYLDYQKNLATHPKIAENISQHIIKDCLYDKPVFANPFKE